MVEENQKAHRIPELCTKRQAQLGHRRVRQSRRIYM